MIAILSDIHANYSALESVLDHAFGQGAKEIICLGDVVGYNGQPEECVQCLKKLGAKNILGNHDSYITTGRNCERSKVVAGVINKHREDLSQDSLEWLAKSVSHITKDDTLMVHGGPNDFLDEYLYSVAAETIPIDFTRLFAGHTHVQTRIDFGSQKTFVNPGSVGQPRDGDPRAAYALIAADKIELHRVDYDIERTVNAMKAKDYGEHLWRGLYTGTQINGKVSLIQKI